MASSVGRSEVIRRSPEVPAEVPVSSRSAPRTGRCTLCPPGGRAGLGRSAPCVPGRHSSCSPAPLPEAGAAPAQPARLASPHCATLLNLTGACHFTPPRSNPGACFPLPSLPVVWAASLCLCSCLLAALGDQHQPCGALGSFSHISQPLYPAQLCLWTPSSVCLV